MTFWMGRTYVFVCLSEHELRTQKIRGNEIYRQIEKELDAINDILGQAICELDVVLQNWAKQMLKDKRQQLEQRWPMN
jgi:hypothetical protein